MPELFTVFCALKIFNLLKVDCSAVICLGALFEGFC